MGQTVGVFSNVSARWRTRLRWIVAGWALVLVGAVFVASGATVSEQVPARAALDDLDAVAGEAAGYLSGDAHRLSVGPLEAAVCSLTPLRSGLLLSRTVMVEDIDAARLEALASRLGLSAAEGRKAATWVGTTAAYVRVRLTEADQGVAELRLNTGCRPGEAPVGSLRPVPPEGGDGSWAFGALACAGGGRLESWTTPRESLPLAVASTTGGCV